MHHLHKSTANRVQESVGSTFFILCILQENNHRDNLFCFAKKMVKKTSTLVSQTNEAITRVNNDMTSKSATAEVESWILLVI